MSLSFAPVLKTSIVLIPGSTHSLELHFENSSEYDKQLFCTLRSPDGLRLSKNYFDVLVPAEGISIETIKITVPKELRIFYENYFFVLETTDAVLEEDKNFAFFLKCALPWKLESQNKNSTSEEVVFLGDAHAFTYNFGKSHTQSSCALTTHIACAEKSNTELSINCDNTCEIILNNVPLGHITGESSTSLSLSEGINTVCIKSFVPNNSITAEFRQTSDYIPACINPEFM